MCTGRIYETTLVVVTARHRDGSESVVLVEPAPFDVEAWLMEGDRERLFLLLGVTHIETEEKTVYLEESHGTN